MNTIHKAVLSALALGALAPAQAALQARDMDANPATIEAYYDTELNLTWMANANRAKTSGFDADGYMTFAQTQSWVASLNAGAGLYGRTDWRLPVARPVSGGAVFDLNFSADTSTDHSYAAAGTGWKTPTGVSASELGNLYANSLGLQGACLPISPTTCFQPGNYMGFATSLAPFTDFEIKNVRSYWIGTEFAPNTYGVFDVLTGLQLYGGGNQEAGAWAVITGDVAAVVPLPVPEPETYALMLLGLGLVTAAARRKAGR